MELPYSPLSDNDESGMATDTDSNDIMHITLQVKYKYSTNQLRVTSFGKTCLKVVKLLDFLHL